MAFDIKTDAPLPPEINKYLAILSKDPGSMVFAPLAEAYRKAGMLDEAIATAQDGLKIHPNYVSGMVALGRAYYEKGMLIEARETLKKVHAIAPDNIIAANILEEIRKQWPVVSGQGPEVGGQEAEGKVEESIEEVTPVFEVVAETEPEIIEALELEELEEVAEAEEVEAEEEEAVTAYGEEITEELWTGETISEEVKVEVEEKEEEGRPKREITTSTIADLYIKQGYIDKAIDIYETLYNANPYNEEIKKKLDELKKKVEVKEEVEEFGVGWAEATGQETLAPLPPTPLKQELVGAGFKPAPTEEAIDKDTENIKRLESWLRTIQSERRKV